MENEALTPPLNTGTTTLSTGTTDYPGRPVHVADAGRVIQIESRLDNITERFVRIHQVLTELLVRCAKSEAGPIGADEATELLTILNG